MISIVDDDESVREATKGLVRSLGYVAATFASSEEFLNSDRVNDTSCLISDVQMPGLNGLELLSVLVTQNIVGESQRIGFGSAIAVVLLAISLVPIVLYLTRTLKDEPA